MVFISLFNTDRPSKRSETGVRTSKPQTSPPKKITEIHPQPRAAKRFRLRGVQLWNWQPLQNFHCFPKRPELSKWSQNGSRNWSFQHPEPINSKKESTKTIKNTTTQHRSESRFWCPRWNTSHCFLLSTLGLEPFWDQNRLRVFPQSPQDGFK